MEQTAPVTLEKDAIGIVRDYLNAARARDVLRLGVGFDKEIIWHQPGANSVSGTYRGMDQLFDLFLRLDGLSGGTFKIDSIEEIMANDELVTAIVRYSAKGQGDEISMVGVDLFRVMGGKIVEVWPFSPNQPAEDRFWDRLAAIENINP